MYRDADGALLTDRSSGASSLQSRSGEILVVLRRLTQVFTQWIHRARFEVALRSECAHFLSRARYKAAAVPTTIRGRAHESLFQVLRCHAARLAHTTPRRCSAD